MIVSPDFDKYRIDKFLQFKLKEFSRTRLQSLIRDGEVKLNNSPIIDSSKKIKKDDEIKINFPEPKETHIEPNNIPLDVLYNDDDLIVINKSPGIVVHPGAGNYKETIVNALLFKYKNNL